jgi:prevent-host-death family protein
MVRQVNLYEAKTQLSQLVEDAAKGEEIVIAKNGKPMAKLSAAPANEDKPMHRELGQWAKLITPEERAYLRSKQFLQDWKAMDAEIERDFYQGLEDNSKDYNSKWPDTFSTPTSSSAQKARRKRSAKKRSLR